MSSFRFRLTLSYAALSGVLLVLLSAVLVTLVGLVITRPAVSTLEDVSTRARVIVAQNPRLSDSALFQRVAAIPHPALIVHRHGVSSFGDRRQPRPHGLFNIVELSMMFGLQPRQIPLREGTIFIAPDLDELNATIRSLLIGLALGVAAALRLSWFIGGWFTAQALAPLRKMTGELERFAHGDFTPRPISTSDRSELGRLVNAYNGAATQVGAAFQERRRVEEHMRRLLGEASHEMRTPLTIVIGYLDLLQRRGLDDVQLRERAFSTLKIETKRLQSLVDRLMVLARLEGTEHSSAEPVDVVDVARGAIDEAVAARGGEVSLQVPDHDDDAVVLADPAEIHEAIINLVDNALKYGRPPVEVAVEADERHVVVRVRDRGPGIGAADRERLFERFFRGAQSAGVDGSGLGLAIVQRAAERSGGSVVLEPDPGRPGAAFRIELPAYRPPETAAPLIVFG